MKSVQSEKDSRPLGSYEFAGVMLLALFGMLTMHLLTSLLL